MKQVVVIVVGLIVALFVVASVCADTPPKCKKCGAEINGSYFETGGGYYHPQHFTCEQCGKPIKGEYTTYRRQNYHTRCFEKNVALKCAVCGDVIQGEHLIDFWENAYHLEHQKDTKACEYCSRFISAITTGGGVKYSDDRFICNICRPSAVTGKDKAVAIMSEVARHLDRYGITVDPGAVNIHLVGLDAMQEKSGRESHRLTGFTDFEETKHLFGITTDRRIDVYLLYGMPRVDVVSTLAHELTHVWQFMAGRFKNDRALSEGSCNYAAYLVLRNYSGKQTEYVISNIENDKDKIYGDGFRRVKRFAEENGIAAWLRLLRKKDRLPSGY